MKNDDSPKRTEIRIERVFEAPPSDVYRAWTDPVLMSRWIWASLGKEVWGETDLRVGGAYRVYTRFAGGRHQGEGWSGMCGIYIEIETDRRLVYTLHWDADVGYNRPDQLTLDEVVAVEFIPDGDRTRVLMIHMGIPDDGVSAMTHRVGIEQSLDMLAALLTE